MGRLLSLRPDVKILLISATASRFTPEPDGYGAAGFIGKPFVMATS